MAVICVDSKSGEAGEVLRESRCPPFVVPKAMSVTCVDISKWQAGFNFQTFKAAGGLGVILKATEGTSVKDSSYPTFRPQALAQGLKVATYHFLRSSDPVAQANFYLAYAAPDQGERVVCDWEDVSCTAAMVVNFLKTIQGKRPDLELTVYCSALFGPAQTTNQWLADNTSLWVARYTSASSPAPFSPIWKQWSLWQYTDQVPSSGPVPGFNGAVDLNRFNGPDENFLAWMGPAGGDIPAPSPPVASVPTLTISSDQPVTLAIAAGPNVTIANLADA